MDHNTIQQLIPVSTTGIDGYPVVGDGDLVPDHESARPVQLSQETSRAVGTGILAFGDVDIAYTNPPSSEAYDRLTDAEYRDWLVEGFAPFEDSVSWIKEELKTKPAQEVGGYLAAGKDSDVFIVERDGVQFAARIVRGDDKVQKTEHYVRDIGRGRGIRRLEQLVGISSKEAATVGELIPGKSMDKYSTSEVASVQDGHFRDLANTTIDAAERGIGTDGNDGNLLLDLDAGFGLLDFSARDPGEARGIAHSITEAIFKITYWLPGGEIPKSEHPEDYAVLGSVLEDLVPTYDRWLRILTETEQLRTGGQDFLTRVDELRLVSEVMKAAQRRLATQGIVEELITVARQEREESVQKFRTNAASAPNDYIRDRYLQRAEQFEQPQSRFYPKGNRWQSRNDTR